MTADPPRTTRRGLLALAGGTALAGCGGPTNQPDPSGAQIDGGRLAEVAAGEVPVVPRTVPVAIGDDHVQGHVDRTDALLSRAPLPLDQQELPNGAMRQEVNEAAEEARTALERARTAASAYEAISALHDARLWGRTVAAAWAYVDEGLRREDLADDADALDGDIATFRDRWSYVGDDPVRALLVHGRVETLVTAAADDAEGRPDNPRVTDRPENLLTVSGYAGHLERGRAALADATHLYDRLRADLATTRDVADVFDATLDELLETLRAATADFERTDPVSAHVDADIEQSPVRHSLKRLFRGLGSIGTVDYRVASALLSAHSELIQLRAFEDLRERVEGGETYAVQSAEDVAAFRETAVTAIETALRETDHPHLSREVLHDVAGSVEHVDRDVGRVSDDREQVPVDPIRRDVGDYVRAAAVARVTPSASRAVAARLEG